MYSIHVQGADRTDFREQSAQVLVEKQLAQLEEAASYNWYFPILASLIVASISLGLEWGIRECGNP